MDEIQRLRAEHDRNASREKGKRVPRVRTDADRIKEKERSARRRREQTDQQREKERLRSLKRRRAMTPEQRKAASVKRVERRQHQRAAAAFPSEPLVQTPLVGSAPPQYTETRGPETDPRTTNAESASAEGASARAGEERGGRERHRGEYSRCGHLRSVAGSACHTARARYQDCHYVLRRFTRTLGMTDELKEKTFRPRVADVETRLRSMRSAIRTTDEGPTRTYDTQQ